MGKSFDYLIMCVRQEWTEREKSVLNSILYYTSGYMNNLAKHNPHETVTISEVSELFKAVINETPAAGTAGESKENV